MSENLTGEVPIEAFIEYMDLYKAEVALVRDEKLDATNPPPEFCEARSYFESHKVPVVDRIMLMYSHLSDAVGNICRAHPLGFCFPVSKLDRPDLSPDIEYYSENNPFGTVYGLTADKYHHGADGITEYSVVPYLPYDDPEHMFDKTKPTWIASGIYVDDDNLINVTHISHYNKELKKRINVVQVLHRDGNSLRMMEIEFNEIDNTAAAHFAYLNDENSVISPSQAWADIERLIGRWFDNDNGGNHPTDDTPLPGMTINEELLDQLLSERNPNATSQGNYTYRDRVIA